MDNLQRTSHDTCGGVSRPRGPASPPSGRVFFLLGFNVLELVYWSSVSEKERVKEKEKVLVRSVYF